jgi:ABC-type glycerol-3-phosphate transport system substrate-binding protein
MMVRFSTLAIVGCAAVIGLAGCGHKTASTVTPAASDVTEFDSAVRDGDTDIVSRLIKAKPEMVNAKDENGKTPVTIATEKGDQEMANLLRRHGGHE